MSTKTPKPSSSSTRSGPSAPRSFGNASTGPHAAWAGVEATDTQGKPDNSGDGKPELDTGPRKEGEGDQTLTPCLSKRRSGNLSLGCTIRGAPLDPLPTDPILSPRSCGWAPCSASLAGRDPRARFCSRAHKENEKNRLQRAEKSAGKEIYWLCDFCNQLYLGQPPTCPTHRCKEHHD